MTRRTRPHRRQRFGVGRVGRAVVRAPQYAVLGLITWNTLTSVWGWATPRPAPVSSRRQRFRVVVPAHDEAVVIGALLDDLSRLDSPSDRYDVWVLADRCSDATVEIATAAGAQVDERSHAEHADDGDLGGKGSMLARHLSRHPLSADEAIVIVDADNRVPRDLLARMADELAAGEEALQAYLDVTNPDESILATASALTYWAGNRMVQQARQSLGWSADLGGTGMCLTARAVEAAGGLGSGLTEDADLHVRLAIAGIRVGWLHDVRVRDEKPAGVVVAVRQRARWVAGKRQVARRWVVPLLRHAWEERSFRQVDVALRLVQPGRSFIALVGAALAVTSFASRSRWLLSSRIWAGATALQLLLPIAFLVRDAVPRRYVLRYPLVTVIAALWIPVRVVSSRVEGWYHTPHRGV